MARPPKVSDERIISLIQKGFTYPQITEELGKRLSWPRYQKLLKQAEAGFDLQKGDTVSKDGVWYRVTNITETDFTIKEIREHDIKKARERKFTKEHYLSGKGGFVKRDTPPVKTYNIKDLEKEKDMSEIMNNTAEFEHEKVEAVNDMPLPVPFDPTAELTEDIKRRDEETLCLEQKIKDLEKQVAEKDGAVSAYRFALQCLAGGAVDA